MDDEIKNKGRLKLALSMLDGRQTSRYSRLCSTGKPTVLARLNIATDLFDDKQTDKFAARIAIHEGFRMPPKSCKGGDCRECKTGKRFQCPYFKQADAIIVDRLGLTIRRKRKQNKSNKEKTCE